MEINLKRVIRTDSIPLNHTYFTDEGYLIDEPIVTTTGIFEYRKPDGTVRRELRLPQEVFSEESLASYEGKPIIITHKAGEVDKDNVKAVTIGTILSKGYKDGSDVRAKIVIHDTDAMKDSGLRELSLGYELDLDEVPGEWEGMPYDAIQRGIKINHLALVENARAGKTARLNVDSREENSEGGIIVNNSKTKKPDGTELAAAIDELKDRKANTDVPAADPVVSEPEDRVVAIKERKDSRPEPTNLDEAMKCIKKQDEDIDTLLGMIDAMKAEKNTDSDDVKEVPAADEEEVVNKDENDIEEDEADCGDKTMNADSIDEIIRERVKLARIGDRLNMDGLENMSIVDAKKAIINHVKPSMRLDGTSRAYVDAAFDIALSEINERKGTNHQRKQMFNADSVQTTKTSSAAEARQRMIEKRNGGNK